MAITRIIIAPTKKGAAPVYKIINLETAEPIPDVKILHSLFADGITAKMIEKMPKGRFKEVMFHNGVIDPQQKIIIDLCAHRGITVEAAKVGYRYYSNIGAVYVNKTVHVAFTEEPMLTTLKPRGVPQEMQYYDLTKLDDVALQKLSSDRQLSLTLAQMKKLVEFQKRLKLESVTDVFLETFGVSWSDHCFHTLWKALGLLDKLQEATKKIANPNLVSAFVDNAGAWSFYDGMALLFKLETHNSPTQIEPYGGQATKMGGDIRDIFEHGLGGKPRGVLELTVVGEMARLHFVRLGFSPMAKLVRRILRGILRVLNKDVRYPELRGNALSAATIGSQTVKAVRDYCNPMGIPMFSASMMSHPRFGGKPFALGGVMGTTTMEGAKKGTPRKGDLAVIVGGRTGNDGLHGATVSSSGVTQETDKGDSTHVQIGLPFIEQLMMRAGEELRDAGCVSSRNDFGAGGVISCFGEMGKGTDGVGGFFCNLALLLLKCAHMAYWQIATSESQERFGHAIKPEMLDVAMAIYKKYHLEATVIGVFTDTGRMQIIYDPKAGQPTVDTALTGEVCLDVPYAFLEECPLPQVHVEEPKPKKEVSYPKITLRNVETMGAAVVGNFDVSNQSWATTQYDSTVQGRTIQGPLYGVNYDVATSVAVTKPIFEKPYGALLAKSFSPWQFEADPINAAVNAMMDVIATLVAAGVSVSDICLSDNFYTDGSDPMSLWYLVKQVHAIADLSVVTGTPFIVGKDSSSGRGKFGGITVAVPPSLCVTGMGKVPDVARVVLHQWRRAGNTLLSLGPRATRLDGSILSASLGITGTKLDRFPQEDVVTYLKQLSVLSQSGVFRSAVPVNRGGLFQKLFEGVVASGYGVETDLCAELFPESYGSVLVEVTPEDAFKIHRDFPELQAKKVGTILPAGRFVVQGKTLNLALLHNEWQSTFEEALKHAA